MNMELILMQAEIFGKIIWTLYAIQVGLKSMSLS